MNYPKFMYRLGEDGKAEALLFQSEAEEKAAKGELFDSPAKVHGEDKKKHKKVVK